MIKTKHKFLQSYGKWALITGASSGIGKAIALQLANKGLNVVLLARRKDKLTELALLIEKQYKVKTLVLVADLVDPDSIQAIKSQTKHLEIGLLVNNAGAGFPGAFLKQEREKRAYVIKLNVLAPMELTHIFADRMVERKRGGILFVSSIAAHMGAPYLANYVATKSYLLSFGTALEKELKKHNVGVTTLLPGPTRTEMMEMDGVDHNKMPDMFMSAEAVAEAGIKKLGKGSFVTAGRMNKMMGFMMSRVMSKNFAQSLFGNMISKAMDRRLL